MSIDNTEYPQLAKKAVAQTVNLAMESELEVGSDDHERFTIGQTVPEDFYVVWFVKVLQNWKALVSTDLVNGHYFEVTHNGDKGETYVDWYNKTGNTVLHTLNG